jgi:iron complex outermembrane recepter protein
LRPARPGVGSLVALLVATLSISLEAQAEVVAAEPETPIVAPFPRDASPIETQVVLQLVVDTSGRVESAVVISRAPADAPRSFDAAALEAVKQAPFRPSQRDGRAIRSRVEYVVVFHPPVAAAARDADATSSPVLQKPAGGSKAPAAAPAKTTSEPLSSNEQDEDYLQVEVRGSGWAAPRGIGDLRIKRELLEASPRQQTSELLAAAPGFFVDHEDGEGLGNDLYLRGFDLEHGSGIEMRVGNVPINNPVHVHGQGYADANFIVPEVVRSIRVLQGPYDPRQGDTAIVGSAYFDLGVLDRGNLLKASYGSWNQMRLVGITAPAGFDEQTFAAFALRKTDGFGARRASESGSVNAQYGIDLGAHNHVRVLATAYTARATLPGVVREDDMRRGLIGRDESYPYFAHGQGVQTSRAILNADLDHTNPSGTRFEFAPWLMWTNFRARRNFTGNIYSSALDPELAGGLGDLWETTNRETAFGVTSRLQPAPLRVGSWLETRTEPGIYVRSGHTDQAKSLLNPSTLQVWDRRLHAGLHTLDMGAYLDIDLRAWKRVRLSGGVRTDFLAVSVDNRLGYDIPARAQTGAIPGATRSTQGLVVSPRATLEYAFAPEVSAVIAYGEGFRSLAANANVATSGGIAGEGPSIKEGGKPYSKVRSVEAGLRTQVAGGRLSTSVALFETRVANELVFEATSGGFSTEGASVRRGVVASALAKPYAWLLASVAGSVSSSTFTTLVPGVSHYVPNVPPVLLRADVTARGRLTSISGTPLTARAGIGYTFLAGRHLTDYVVGPANHVLNGGAALRYEHIELGVDAYNMLNLEYADEAEFYVSNWSVQPGTPLASPAIHLTQAPPLTLLGSLAVYF